jgi:hypothetical protein
VECDVHLFNHFSFFLFSELGVDAPFPNPIRELQSSHRDTVVRISYFPKISYGPEDFADGTSGRYYFKMKYVHCYFISLLMKTLDWSVETLGGECNSFGICLNETTVLSS